MRPSNKTTYTMGVEKTLLLTASSPLSDITIPQNKRADDEQKKEMDRYFAQPIYEGSICMGMDFALDGELVIMQFRGGFWHSDIKHTK